jgi:hypothetical protein
MQTYVRYFLRRPRTRPAIVARDGSPIMNVIVGNAKVGVGELHPRSRPLMQGFSGIDHPPYWNIWLEG